MAYCDRIVSPRIRIVGRGSSLLLGQVGLVGGGRIEDGGCLCALVLSGLTTGRRVHLPDRFVSYHHF